jgi:hypothetical protein
MKQTLISIGQGMLISFALALPQMVGATNPTATSVANVASNRVFTNVTDYLASLPATPRISTLPAISFSPTEGANVIQVNEMKDFPAPYQGTIKLLPTKMYVISGPISIGNNCINMNGAGMRGLDPGKDFVISSVAGAVIRSRDVDVYMEDVGVICASTETSGYDFQDLTGTRYLNIFAGCSVLDAPNVQSVGVGRVTGFNTVCIEKNFWRCKDGVKVTGNMQKWTNTLNYVTGITKGAAIEFLANAVINDVIVQSCYFVYAGEVGIKFNNGASVDQGRLTLNLFRGVTNLLVGFDSFTPGWEMSQNGVGVPDSKGMGYLYMTDNSAPTGFKTASLFSKINGMTKVLKNDKFTTGASNKFIFTGRRTTALNVFAAISAKASPSDDGNAYSIVIMKNGTEQVLPNSTVTALARNQGFQLTLQTQVEMIAGDFIEVWLKSNNNTTPIVISDLQFKISE